MSDPHPFRNVEDNWAPNLAAKASLISERFAGEIVFDESQQAHQSVQTRLEKWCQAVAKGDWQRFEHRLTQVGFDLGTVRRILGGGRLAEDQPLPAWAHTILAVIQVAETSSPISPARDTSTLDRCIDPTEPLPFEDVLWPFVQVARQRLEVQPDVNYALLPEVCQVSFERNLLRTLSRIGGHTFWLAFSVFRELWETDFVQSAPDKTSRIMYLAFVQDLLQDGLQTFFQGYSVLARLLATQTDFWVEAIGEFLRRLQADWPAIRRIFPVSEQSEAVRSPLAHLSRVQPGLSDPHHRGRTVIGLEFDGGLKLVYKPKNLGVEVAYQDLLIWLNDQGLSPPLKPLKLLSWANHGWVEFIEPLPCQNQMEAAQFYHRAGMTLALLYTLCGSDYHNENVIASGVHPIPVDHEMLMQPYFHDMQYQEGVFSEDEIQTLANQQAAQSVLSTMLLPTWQDNEDGQPYDISAWGVSNIESQTFQQLRWEHINTDCMARVKKPISRETAQMPNVPILDGVALPLHDYLGDFCTGFRNMYTFLLDRRENLLAPGGPLVAFKGQRIRFVFRHTRAYQKLLQTSLASKYMRDGADRSIQLELFGRAWLASKQRLWPLLNFEQAAMAQMDIPLFITTTDSRGIMLPDGEILENCFSETGYQLAVSRLTSLSEVDLEKQLGLITVSLLEGDTDEIHHSHHADSVKPNLANITPLTPEQMVQQAVEIGQTLKKRAIYIKDEVFWTDLIYINRSGQRQFQILDYDLYRGSCGVALFFAALGKITADREYHELALVVLRPLHRFLQSANFASLQDTSDALAEPAALQNIGGGHGLGSVIYALVRISQFLNKPTLLEDARRLTSLLTSRRIAQDGVFGVLAGAAGTILGLLALYKAGVQSAVLDQAATCGQYLLESRTMSATGQRVWLGLHSRPLTGFSHGAAGIAYALLQLYEATGDMAYREAAQEAIAYENNVFDAEAGNWPDFGRSKAEGPGFRTSWCHGAPGIGLARLGGLPILDTTEIRTNIEIALETTCHYGPRGVDHLCCGTLGRAEFLLATSSYLSRPELLATARTWAAWIIDRAKQNGNFALDINPQLNWAYKPGIFQGTAGIGYELLRLAHPNQLPSILLWE